MKLRVTFILTSVFLSGCAGPPSSQREMTVKNLYQTKNGLISRADERICIVTMPNGDTLTIAEACDSPEFQMRFEQYKRLSEKNAVTLPNRNGEVPVTADSEILF